MYLQAVIGATRIHLCDNLLQLQNCRVWEGLSKRAINITCVLRKVRYNESFKEFNLSIFLRRRLERDVIILPKYLRVEKIVCSVI